MSCGVVGYENSTFVSFEDLSHLPCTWSQTGPSTFSVLRVTVNCLRGAREKRLMLPLQFEDDGAAKSLLWDLYVTKGPGSLDPGLFFLLPFLLLFIFILFLVFFLFLLFIYCTLLSFYFVHFSFLLRFGLSSFAYWIFITEAAKNLACGHSVRHTSDCTISFVTSPVILWI